MTDRPVTSPPSPRNRPKRWKRCCRAGAAGSFPPPYARWKAVNRQEKVSVAAYTSGKLVVQGGGTADFVSFLLEPEILHTFTFGLDDGGAAAEPVDPHGGIDESGKGDFFGPLVIAGVYADAETGPELRKIGCCDSKLIHSSKRIMELAGKIRAVTGGRYAVVTLYPGTYNRLYREIGNLNRLLAWGHARTIENLLEKVPECPRMLSDKFGDERLIQRALLARGRTVQMDQRTKAESDVAVAAASILAREQFLKGMAKLSAEVGVPLPAAAGRRYGPSGKNCSKRTERKFSSAVRKHTSKPAMS
ncbi:MAG: ribonuclease HIII [Lentisphaeria bacterium]|nr:MAG: ribonuclease HIII [Lentisphaeria bacterium]